MLVEATAPRATDAKGLVAIALDELTGDAAGDVADDPGPGMAAALLDDRVGMVSFRHGRARGRDRAALGLTRG